MDCQMKENNNTYEYIRSVKILNNLSSDTFEEIRKICNEIEELLREIEIKELVMERFVQTLKDLQVLKEVTVKHKRIEPINEQQVIELIAAMVNLICNMLNELNRANKLIFSMNISRKTKATTCFHLKFLRNILKEIII
ncbi:hypothetical protein [Litchfieldia alkalitelluris]|uniref:hypothetical protein n=1 Tax=Litchfieldia alkalitelluris TaxID=304268 RepID=UPI0009982DA7|nr:hypothetical protein [Litchfieldia alkalitelluris]